jgi:hypothetical protein
MNYPKHESSACVACLMSLAPVLPETIACYSCFLLARCSCNLSALRHLLAAAFQLAHAMIDTDASLSEIIMGRVWADN